MMQPLQHFFYMGGYAAYVWPAYGIAFFSLLIQWFLPWRRWHRYLRDQKNKISHE